MDFQEGKLNEYVTSHTTPESNLLQEINRETHSQVLMPQMLSGHLQGRFLSMVSKMVRPDYILEIGTYTGYSALCLAEGLSDNGRLITIDISEELEERVRSYFSKSKVENKIEYLVGNALDLIPKLDSGIDLVFIDADKENYSNYFDLVSGKLKAGGYIIADNVLWSGKVFNDQENDTDTRALRSFNKKIQQASGFENILLPIRDGLMLIRKNDG